MDLIQPLWFSARSRSSASLTFCPPAGNQLPSLCRQKAGVGGGGRLRRPGTGEKRLRAPTLPAPKVHWFCRCGTSPRAHGPCLCNHQGSPRASQMSFVSSDSYLLPCAVTYMASSGLGSPNSTSHHLWLPLCIYIKGLQMPGIQPPPSSGSFHWDPQEKPFESWAMHFTSWGEGGDMWGDPSTYH